MAFYQNAHYLLHSADYEGQPFAILEAFAAGIPVIADDILIESQPELAVGMISISNAFKHPEKLSDPELYHKRSIEVRNLHEDNFSLKKMTENTLAYYREISETSHP